MNVILYASRVNQDRERDLGWIAFSRALSEAMQGDPDKGIPEMTNRELELQLHLAGEGSVTQAKIRRWRSGAGRPPLAQIPTISRILGMGARHRGEHDPSFILREMGLLDRGPSLGTGVDLALRLSKLQQKYQEAIARQGEFSRTQGVLNVIAAGVQSGKWAVAVWPVISGTDECQMHVADRIDIRRADGTPTTDEEVWADGTLKTALRDCYALRTSVGYPHRRRWSTDDDPGVSRWAVSHVGSPFSNIVSEQHQGLRSVSISAITVQSWVNDVGALLAFALGYGFTLTRDLASEISGASPGATTMADRHTVHSELLKRPPRLRVWTHHAPPLDGAQHYLVESNESTGRIHIHESDVLLKRHHSRRQVAGDPNLTVDDLRRYRDQVANAAAAGDQVLVLEAKEFDLDDTAGRWRQSLEHSHAALQFLMWRYEIGDAPVVRAWPRVKQAHPSTAAPYLDWLSKEASTQL